MWRLASLAYLVSQWDREDGWHLRDIPRISSCFHRLMHEYADAPPHMNMDEYTHVRVYICKDIRQGGRHMTEDNAVTKCRTWVNEHTVGLLYTSQCKSVEKHRKRFAVLGSSFKELSPSQCWHPLGHTFVLDAPLSLIFGQYFKNLPEARQIRQGGEWGIKTSSCLLFIFFQVGLWCFPVLPPE